MEDSIEGCLRQENVADHNQQQQSDISKHDESNIVGDGSNQMMQQNVSDMNLMIDESEIEMIEEDTVGQIVQGEDGEYYVVVEDGAPDVELDHLSSIQVVTNEDGTETLVLENDESITNATDESAYNNDQGGNKYAMVEVLDGVVENTIHSDSNMNMSDNTNDSMKMDESNMNDGDSGEALYIDGMIDPLPQGIKLRRNRVYGTCRCPECGQSFVNTARLERHLAVHQVFGSFLCPLCGKTYKYEYNLFYHWRKTCRDLNALLGLEERRTMDVGALRQVVEEVAQKKTDIGPIDIGINRRVLYATTPLDKLEMPSSLHNRRGNICRSCGIIILPTHMPRHLNLHKGDIQNLDERCLFGGYCCDLCGILFRQHNNLIKHWRTACPEIQTNIPEDEEIVLDDDGLKCMIMKLLKRPVPHDAYIEAIKQCEVIMSRSQSTSHKDEHKTQGVMSKMPSEIGDAHTSRTVSQQASYSNNNNDNTLLLHRDANSVERIKENENSYNDLDDRMLIEQGAVYADDFGADEEALIVNEDGVYASSLMNRNRWSVGGGPVQCPECFRTFANIGRLERHMAGYHASFGSHHCILCGNRFKYDYNLLYHYRRSCPYTKIYIDREMREQLDATNLRKLVRKISQEELPSSSPLSLNRLLHNKDLLYNKRQMLRYQTNLNNPLPQLLIPKPGLQHAKSCPVCSVIFYGTDVVERHIKAAHPIEWELQFSENAINATNINRSANAVGSIHRGDDGENGGEYETDDVEPPPTLTAESPVEQPVVRTEPIIRRAHHIEVDEDGNQKLVDENGVVIEAAEGEEVHVEMDDLGDVQRLIDSGQLQVEHGDQIILVEGDDVNEYEQNIGDEGTTATEYQIIRTDQTASGVEGESSNIIYDNDSNKVDKSHRKDKDEGLEIAAILTEMKQNEGQKLKVVVHDETAEPKSVEGINIERKRTSEELCADSGLESAMRQDASKGEAVKRSRLITEPSEIKLTDQNSIRTQLRRPTRIVTSTSDSSKNV